MALTNGQVADVLGRVADLLEIEGANRFRVRAYRNAADVVRGLSRRLSDLVREQADLEELPGIGVDLAGKLEEIVRTGALGLLGDLERTTSPDLPDLLAIPGLGPKRVRALHEELGVKSLADLRRAVERGALRTLAGFGAKTEASIRKALAGQGPGERRMLWVEAEAVAEDLVAWLRRQAGVLDVEVAGSFRRRRETVGDLDLLVTCRRGVDVTSHFVRHEDVRRVLARGDTRATVVLASGLQVDLRVVPRVSYGAALYYFTGSKAHNVAVRTRAKARGLKVNEYGVFRGERRVAGRTEAEVFRAVGLTYIPPELREDRGEIGAALEKRLPRLVEVDDVRGDLHVHTSASDGHDALEAMVEAAASRGYEYVAITDHTQNARIAHGLSRRAWKGHLKAIEKADARSRKVRVLKSAEVDVLPDGSLDLPDGILDALDVVVCAVHAAFGLSRARQTARLLRALDHPRCHVLAHPTGRLLGRREPYDVDLDAVVAAAVERGVLLEVNAQPERLDLDDVAVKAARERGARFVISTDAHGVAQLDLMRLGVAQARRGWLEARDVANTLPWPRLERLLRRP